MGFWAVTSASNICLIAIMDASWAADLEMGTCCRLTKNGRWLGIKCVMDQIIVIASTQKYAWVRFWQPWAWLYSFVILLWTGSIPVSGGISNGCSKRSFTTHIWMSLAARNLSPILKIQMFKLSLRTRTHPHKFYCGDRPYQARPLMIISHVESSEISIISFLIVRGCLVHRGWLPIICQFRQRFQISILIFQS